MSDPHIDEATVGFQMPIGDIIPYPKNSKIHTPNQIKEISKSIEKFGWTSRVVVNEKNVIIQGHGRTLAAQLLGLETVPVTVRRDLTPLQERLLRIVDNKTAQGKSDSELLNEELAELMDFDVELDDFFSKKDLVFIMDDIEIDMDALSDELEAEVESQSEETQSRIDDEDGQEYQAVKAFGFSKVNADQQRAIKLFMAHVESEVGQEGAEGLSVFCREFLGL